MILDCCGQQRTYEKFFGLLAQVSGVNNISLVYEIVKNDSLQNLGSWKGLSQVSVDIT